MAAGRAVEVAAVAAERATGAAERTAGAAERTVGAVGRRRVEVRMVEVVGRAAERTRARRSSSSSS